MRCLLITFLSGCVLAGATRGEPAQLADRIAADAPVSWWRFDESAPPAGAQKSVTVISGPGHENAVTLPAGNRAAHFAGDGARIEVDGEEHHQFRNGEEITIEAWVRLGGIGRGQNSYIIGKGRLDPGSNNQNWALRLREAGGKARISFLFRSQPGEDGAAPNWHRWTSDAGIAPGPRWHHVAVTYTFGKPDSVRGVIDGEVTKGKWDMGGATTQPPVVDGADVWIGSSMNGSSGSSFRGALDEIALYRRALPVETLSARYEELPVDEKPPRLAAVAKGEVLVEVREEAGDGKDWAVLANEAGEVFPTGAFAVTTLPHRYNSHGARVDRRAPVSIRLAAEVSLPPGDYEFLLRSSGPATLATGEDTVVSIGSVSKPRGAHGKLRPLPEEAPGYPRRRMGTEEKIERVSWDGEDRVVTLHTVSGSSRSRFEAGEILAAYRREGDSHWRLLTANGVDAPLFDTESFASFQREERERFARLDTERRRAASLAQDEFWRRRHEEAATHVATLPPIQVPGGGATTEPSAVIDAFLTTAIEENNRREGAVDSGHARALAVLEAACYRCHGDKAKGGLKLDTREAALATTTESGLAAIVPGDPAKSELLYRLTTEDPDLVMPPKGEGVSADELDLIRAWIEDGAPWANRAGRVDVPGPAGDLAFLRRLHLDTVGVLPTAEECRSFLADDSPDRIPRLVDRLLSDPRHADHWVSYWQDVLAENPRLVKPVLNNTGPFRYWIHEALLDNKPMDRFVHELVTFQGSVNGGGAGGFSRAAENDVPMAAKAHIVGTAFLGVEMKCARCHDSPFHSTTQEDLFSLAAMLKGAAIEVPETSTVPAAFFEHSGGRDSMIEVTLDIGKPVEPRWPFSGMGSETPSEDLAHQITRAENERFAQVVVNRVWRRYFGEGFVEPVDDWEGNTPSHPDLLAWLARDFVGNGYDMQRLSRIILNTEAYRRAARAGEADAGDGRFFAAPLRRRVSAEQLVDSLLAASGVPNYSEELTFDVEAAHSAATFLNMGRPGRAWQMISLASDRDRPSLTLPRADSITAVMKAHGWRPNRSEPLSDREREANVLQPGMLGNGLLGIWVSRLSDYSDLTGLAIEAESPERLIEELYLRFLTRFPTDRERDAMVELLKPGFDERVVTKDPGFEKKIYTPPVREISWANHLNAEANQLAAEIEEEARRGPEATSWLDSDWRVRMEDVVWALANSPEMQFVP